MCVVTAPAVADILEHHGCNMATLHLMFPRPIEWECESRHRHVNPLPSSSTLKNDSLFFLQSVFTAVWNVCTVLTLPLLSERERESWRKNERMRTKKERKNVFDNYSFVNAEALLLFHNNSAVMESNCVHERVCVSSAGAERRKVLRSNWGGPAQYKYIDWNNQSSQKVD